MNIAKLYKVLKDFKKQVKFNDNNTIIDVKSEVNSSKVHLNTTIDGWKIDTTKTFETKKEKINNGI